MNKAQLIDSITKKSLLKKQDIETMVSLLIETIMDEVAEGEKVQITGFGTFERKDRKERKIKVPSTGAEMVVAASKSPSFSAGKTFKEHVNK